VPSQLSTKFLVFIDAAVDDYQSLVKGVVANTEVIVLDSQRDGVEQITEALRDRPTPAAIHIVSHGSPGALYLGNSQLNLRNLAHYADDLAGWAAPQLLLYGCNVAAGDAGSEFIETLSTLTGAAIAASTSPIGNAALGGDWQLEVTTGEIKAALAFRPEAMATYGHVLPAPILFSTNGSIITNGSTAKVIDSALTVSGADPLDGATVLIGTNFNSGQDRLGIAGQGGTSGTVNGLSWSYSTITGLMSITGNASTATYEAALRQVTYYSNGTPTGAPRNIRYSLGRNLSNSANGHFYNFVTNSGIDWGVAQSAAAGSNYFGLQGYLATITSASEQAFVAGKLQGEGWMGGSDANSEGVWRWVTGPENGQQFWSGNFSGTGMPGQYQNWASGEPNDAGGVEDYAHFLVTGKWNDYAATTSVAGYVVEYGGLAGDPTLQITGSATVNIDTTPPPAPSIPDLTTATDTGISATDNITANNTPTFTGIVQAGNSVNVYDAGTLMGAAVVDGSGNWTFITASALADGVHNITTIVTSGGVASAPSTALAVTIDSTAPTAPGNAPDLAALSDTGLSSTDNLTSNTTPTFVGAPGSGLAGDTITLYEGSTVLGTGTIAANGSWSVTASTLGNGVHNISATFRDVAGNESAPSSALPITISTTAPAAPASAPDLEAASDTGASNTDDLTNMTTPTFVGAPGSGTAGQVVTLYDGNTAVGTATVAVDGSWTATATTLIDGSHAISVSFTDTAGNESARSTALPVTIDSTPPTTPTTAPDLVPASDTGASNTDNVTTIRTPTFVGAPGSGAPGQLVTLYEGISAVTPIGTGVVAADGSWSIAASSLGGGVNTIAFTLTDEAGNESDLSPELSVTIEGVAPNAPVASQLDVASDSGFANNDNLTNDTTPAFTGTNQPGNTVELFAGSVSLGTALVNAAGRWSLTPTSVLADGTYQITLRAISPAGFVSASSPAVPLTIDTRPATAAILEIDQPLRDSGANTLTLRFSEAVRNADPSDLALTLNGQAVPLVGATLTTTDNITWTLGNIPGLTQASGNYQIGLKAGNDITDLAGNALAIGNTESWLTGYTSDAKPSLGFTTGKKGLKVRDGGGGNVLKGKGGKDSFNGGGGNDRLLGRGGSDKLKGGAGKDRLGGGGDNDQLFGGGGADRLKGKKQKDRLVGGAGNDVLIGGGGNDVLVGGKGKDILTGGNGNDSFTFNTLKEAGDRITDFNSTDDLIDVRGIFKAPQFGGDNRFAQYHQFMQLVQVGANTEVKVDTDGKGAGTAFTTLMTLQNVTVGSVKSTNFVVG